MFLHQAQNFQGTVDIAGHSGAAPPEKTETPIKLDTDIELVRLMQDLAIKKTWTQPYVKYLLREQLPDDPTDARQIARRSKAFTIINGELYK